MSSTERLDAELAQQLAAWIRYLKWVNGYTSNAAFARAVGIHRSSMGRYLDGTSTVGLSTVWKVAKAMRSSLDVMFGGWPKDPRWRDPGFDPPPLPQPPKGKT